MADPDLRAAVERLVAALRVGGLEGIVRSLVVVRALEPRIVVEDLVARVALTEGRRVQAGAEAKGLPDAAAGAAVRAAIGRGDIAAVERLAGGGYEWIVVLLAGVVASVDPG